MSEEIQLLNVINEKLTSIACGFRVVAGVYTIERCVA